LLQRTMAQLDDANDPQANLDVGRYFCLVRGEWEKGLPLLANGPQGKLKSLAEAELAGPDSPEQQVALADQWWELVSSESEREKTLRIHAGHWYQRALPALPQGLLRVKAELRIKQIEQDYGPDALASGS
jgi:hypothetical protein